MLRLPNRGEKKEREEPALRALKMLTTLVRKRYQNP